MGVKVCSGHQNGSFCAKPLRERPMLAQREHRVRGMSSWSAEALERERRVVEGVRVGPPLPQVWGRAFVPTWSGQRGEGREGDLGWGATPPSVPAPRFARGAF